MRKLVFLAGLCCAFTASPALAQTATATSPSNTPGGPNQAQMAPSGGTPPGAAGGSAIAEPSKLEKQEEQKSKKDTEICKGC